MKTSNCKFLLLFILFLNIFKIICEEKKVIAIPFSIRHINHSENYNSTKFINDYFTKEIILKFNIGTPSQRVICLIETASECLQLIEDNNNTLIYKERYYPNKSSSIRNIYIRSISDILNFEENGNNYTFNFQIDKNNKINLNNTYIAKMGLNVPFSLSWNNCPNFFLILKKGKAINKLIWTIEYTSKYEGKFIIGEDLSKYDKVKYPEDLYYIQYIQTRYMFNFDSVYIEYNLNKNGDNNNNINNNFIREKVNITQIFINIKSGFIIGPTEYKNIIDKIYFNELVNKDICRIDKIKYIFNIKNQLNIEYYVYSCYETAFNDININYYKNFPNLVFSSKTIEYNFVFTYEDLFEHINDRYYFLIIFQNNQRKKDIIWYFGEPFYKKYSFSMDFDAKAMGFYLIKEKNYTESKDRNNNDEYNKNNEYLKLNKVIKFILEFAFLILLIIFAYYIAKSIKERRKKRANELKDDNYEYLPDKNKNINNNSDDLKQKKFIELNSRLGI